MSLLLYLSCKQCAVRQLPLLRKYNYITVHNSGVQSWNRGYIYAKEYSKEILKTQKANRPLRLVLEISHATLMEGQPPPLK